MTVYKYFIRIALKQKMVILGYATIFLILSIFNGGTTESPAIGFSETRLNIGIIDNSKSDLSKALVDYLGEKNNIIKTRQEDEYIKEQIFLQILDGVVIIPEDFKERVIKKEEAVRIYKNDREISALYLEQQVEKYLVFANASYKDEGFALADLKNALSKRVDIEVMKGKEGSSNRNANEWFKRYYNFTSYIIIAVYVATIGLVMSEFKDEGLENRMKVSSKKFLQLNREIYLGQISLGMVVTSIFILGSLVLKGKYIGEVEFPKYVFNLIIFSFTILCFTFLINNLTRNRFVINGISTVVSLGTSFISGVLVPQEFLSQKVLNLAKFFPTYYFIRINERNVTSLEEIGYEIFMQLLFGLVFLLMGLYFSKNKRIA